MGGSRRSQKTPRSYFSNAQLTLIEKSEEEYIKHYFFGKPGYESEEMRFGRDIAEDLAKEESTNPEAEYLRTFLPSYPKREYEVRCTFQGVPLLGRLDFYDPRRRKIGELKTGRVPWTQRRVDTHDQLTFYHLLLLGRSGRPPTEIALYWAPTERDEDGTIRLTGDIQTFHTSRTLRDLANLTSRIRTAWERIKQISQEIQATA